MQRLARPRSPLRRTVIDRLHAVSMPIILIIVGHAGLADLHWPAIGCAYAIGLLFRIAYARTRAVESAEAEAVGALAACASTRQRAQTLTATPLEAEVAGEF